MIFTGLFILCCFLAGIALLMIIGGILSDVDDAVHVGVVVFAVDAFVGFLLVCDISEASSFNTFVPIESATRTNGQVQVVFIDPVLDERKTASSVKVSIYDAPDAELQIVQQLRTNCYGGALDSVYTLAKKPSVILEKP